jgi:hypothetical protein
LVIARLSIIVVNSRQSDYMETLDEFLGGKYQKKEQIVPGPVQTFRARETATGREVFVHRVSTTDEQAEQMAMLRMLTTVLLRSPEARRRVLDFGEEQGFWYVVTESEPRCLVLREWLQFELSRESNAPAPPKQASAEPPAQPPAEPAHTEPAHTEPVHREAAHSEPGEFTRVFQSVKPEAGQPAGGSSAGMPPHVRDEPGEFTRFFQGGSPGSAGKLPANPEAKRSPDRPSRGGLVQRPNTPVAPLQQKSAEPGEFTRIFSRPNTAGEGKPKDVFPDHATAQPDSAERFSGLRDLPKSLAPEPPQPGPSEPGEYTRIFGGGVPPSPPQPASRPSDAPGSFPADDPLRGTRPPGVVPAPPPQKGPSEYTMVIQGSGHKGDGAVPGPSGHDGEAAKICALPKISGAPPPVKAPQISLPKAPPMPGPAPVKKPGAENRKLIVFFAILAILAVVLIFLVVLAVKK